MFIYENNLPVEIKIDKPDPKFYELLDHQLHGCRNGLEQAMVYIRESFMIHNRSFHDLFLRLGARQITDMEILAELLHQLHGVDDRYYDESNDDTPAFEFIAPCHDEETKKAEKHHVNNDLTACIMRNIQFEERQFAQYEQLEHMIHDQGVHTVLKHLKKSTQQALNALKNVLTILTTHTEQKDFGEGDMHDAWDLDTSNYFDKPNPYFINSSEKERLK